MRNKNNFHRAFITLPLILCFGLTIFGQDTSGDPAAAQDLSGDPAAAQNLSGNATAVSNEIMIQAHAGASLLAPENTLAAFTEAENLGADGIETDVRMTKDHELVVHHDDSIGQTSDGQGNISEMTLEELKALDFGSWFGSGFEGEQILTLEECLEAAKELSFDVVNLELKPVPAGGEDGDEEGESRIYVEAAADAIRHSGYAEHILITSFDRRLLKALKEYAPEIPVGILTVPDLFFLTLFNVSKHLPADKPPEDFETEDLQDVPGMVSMLLKGFGAKGRSPEETLLEVIRGVAAAVPSGTTYNDLKAMIEEQADIVQYVESLDLPVEYVSCHYNSLSKELMEAMHKDQIGVFAWTPDRKTDLQKTIAFAPEGIITNHPASARRSWDREQKDFLTLDFSCPCYYNASGHRRVDYS